MKRFHFNLQRILALREYREKDWEIKLGEVTGRCVRLKQSILERTRNRESALRAWHQTALTDVLYARSMEEYIRRMNHEQARLEVELEQAEAEREEVQKQFIEASRERKVLENLKDKRMQEYYKDQLKTEFKNIDEMNTGAAVRKLRQSGAPTGRA